MPSIFDIWGIKCVIVRDTEGGDPASVKKFHEIGLTYVSASPYRVPLARLAAAQAVLGKAVTTSA